MPSKKVIRKRLVQQLVSIGVEKKHAHSVVGFWLNRWDYQAVGLAILGASRETPIEDITAALAMYAQKEVA